MMYLSKEHLKTTPIHHEYYKKLWYQASQLSSEQLVQNITIEQVKQGLKIQKG